MAPGPVGFLEAGRLHPMPRCGRKITSIMHKRLEGGSFGLLAASTVVSLALAVGVVAGAPRAQPGTTGSPTRGRLMGIYRISLTPTERKQLGLPADFSEKVKKAGWEEVDGDFVTVGPLPDAEISDGSAMVRTDPDGYFDLRVFPADAELAVVGAGKRLPLAYADGSTVSEMLQKRNEVPVWSLELSIKGCCPEPGKVHIQYDEARCLDYNGWWSDGRNYPLSDLRAARNYIASDCDRVGLACWKEHAGLISSCYANHGNKICSTLIGHSEKYHKHNFPN